MISLHHLFADLLRQRQDDAVGLHRCASIWYEENGMEIDAFHHAAAADDIDRAELAGIVLTTTLDSRRTLWVMYASAHSMTGELTAVEPKLQAAESALHNAPDNKWRNLIGHIAAIRALLVAR